MLQSVREDRKAAGAHYTSPELAGFLARRVLSHWVASEGGGEPRVLDPAVGDGQLLLSLLKEFSAAGVRVASVTGYDTDPRAGDAAARRLAETAPGVECEIIERDFLACAEPSDRVNHGLFEVSDNLFDIVITNPPYVRTQVLGAKRAQAIAQRFSLSGRVDLYQAFIRLYESVLRPGGLLGAILSNRFMMTKAGADTRRFFRDHLPPLEVWDLGDTRLFEAAVLPSIIVATKARPTDVPVSRFTSVYQADPSGRAPTPDVVIRSLEHASDPSLLVKRGFLANVGSPSDVWRVETSDDSTWLAQVAHNTALLFRDVGAIRVGIKTTADSVFIGDDWDTRCGEQQPELLRQLVTHREAQFIRARGVRQRKRVLYTHEIRDGKRKPVQLERYPAAAAYLEQHRSRLEGRSYVREAGREWFEIWVPQDPEAWDLPKVVFRDISDVPTFWLGEPGTIVNGDCYWISPKDNESSSLLWLVLGVANSAFALQFYDRRFQNRLYGGRRRFMTQYVEEFPLPDPSNEVSASIVSEVQRLYAAPGEEIRAEDLLELDRLVFRAFGLPVEEVNR